MSGTNTLINSNNTIKGNSQSTLKEALVDANTKAKSIKEIPLKTPIKKK